MGLAEKRAVQEFQKSEFPALKKAIDDAAGFQLPQVPLHASGNAGHFVLRETAMHRDLLAPIGARDLEQHLFHLLDGRLDVVLAVTAMQEIVPDLLRVVEQVFVLGHGLRQKPKYV